MQAYLDDDLDPPLSPAGCAGYLVDYLFDVGPVGYGAMGAVPLGWPELTHWQINTGIALESWEASTLRRLSIEYVIASRAAESPTCPAPWLPESATSADNRKSVAKHIRSVLRS